MAAISIHRSLDRGIKATVNDFAGGTLLCKCRPNPVEVNVQAQTAHNHARGCTKCWKPMAALFSVVAVAPRDKVSLPRDADRLAIIDSDRMGEVRARLREVGLEPYDCLSPPLMDFTATHAHKAAQAAAGKAS